MPDSEFDSLRRKLKGKNSPAVLHKVPTCKVDSGICKTDLQPDVVKNAVLYLPALAGVTVVWSEIAYWYSASNGLSPSPLVSLLLNSPFIAGFTWLITNKLLFQDPLIVKANCPSCGTEQSIYFGDIVFVNGAVRDEVKTECSSPACKAAITGFRGRMVAQCVKADPAAAAPAPAPAAE